jgi:hypothetical protein
VEILVEVALDVLSERLSFPKSPSEVEPKRWLEGRTAPCFKTKAPAPLSPGRADDVLEEAGRHAPA